MSNVTISDMAVSINELALEKERLMDIAKSLNARAQAEMENFTNVMRGLSNEHARVLDKIIAIDSAITSIFSQKEMQNGHYSV